MRPRSPRRWFATLALAALVAAGCDLDEAELIRPGDGVITAEVGQLRVLGYDVDPAADDWIDVLSPDESVVTEVGTFRETDAALLAEGETPGDRRRLFEATGPGRTLLVELNCPDGCDALDPIADVGIHVWDFIVGEDTALSADTPIARSSGITRRRVGEFIVVASEQPGLLRIRPDGDGPVPVEFLAQSAPDDGRSLNVDVFLAIAPGRATIEDAGPDRGASYEIEITDG